MDVKSRLSPWGLSVLLALGSTLAAQAQDKVRIANEGGIRDAWTLAPGTTLAAPGYPASFAARGDAVCLAMGYRIQPDGSTSDFTLLRAWNGATGEQEPEAGYWDAFSQAGAAALSQWKFSPKTEAGMPKPVDTVATLVFAGKGESNVTALRGRCQVADLADFLENAKLKRNRRGDMNQHELERSYSDQRRLEMRANQAARARGP